MTARPQRDRVPGAPWAPLFRAAPPPLQRTLVFCVLITQSLQFLSVQDLSAEELDLNDPRFPLVACAYAEKPS